MLHRTESCMVQGCTHSFLLKRGSDFGSEIDLVFLILNNTYIFSFYLRILTKSICPVVFQVLFLWLARQLCTCSSRTNVVDCINKRCFYFYCSHCRFTLLNMLKCYLMHKRFIITSSLWIGPLALRTSLFLWIIYALRVELHLSY